VNQTVCFGLNVTHLISLTVMYLNDVSAWWKMCQKSACSISIMLCYSLSPVSGDGKEFFDVACHCHMEGKDLEEFQCWKLTFLQLDSESK